MTTPKCIFDKFIAESFDFSEMPGSPCHNCIIKMTCLKSFVNKTACDPYKRFMTDLLDKAIIEYKEKNK